MAGKTGGPTGGMEYSPRKAARRAAARRRQEKSWVAKNGPVEVRRVEDAPSLGTSQVTDPEHEKGSGKADPDSAG